jgi:type IV pilus assembly protein PilW
MKQKVNTVRFQSGLTIVELMVSLTIGLILMGGMVQIFSTNKNAYRYNNSVAEVQNNGAYALDFVVNQIAQIGYVPAWTGYNDQDMNGDGFSDRRDLELWAYGATPPLVGTDGGGSKSDSMIVNVFADKTAVDCVGRAVTAKSLGAFVGPIGITAAGTPGFGIPNVLAIVDDALTCNGVVVAQGVENMQILYGVDTPTPGAAIPLDGVVDRYLDWSQIAPADRLNVMSVRVSLLVASTEQARNGDNTKTLDVLDESIGPAKDRKLRTVYTATVRLRNRCAKFPSKVTSICA